MKASPWLIGANPRDLIMPVDGDDGFYPTGNDLVLLYTRHLNYILPLCLDVDGLFLTWLNISGQKPEVISSNRKYRAHVLVCAPSNSALDEIVSHVLLTG
jgi:senataxin